MSRDEFLWVEKYRPKTIEDCILPDATKKTFKSFLEKGEVPNLLLAGPAGCGKTTVAKALCNELGVDVYVINGSDEGRFLDTVRNTAKNFASTVSLSSTAKHKVIIIDEADNTTNDVDFSIKGKEKAQLAAGFYGRLQDILQKESVKYDSKVLIELINKHFPDWRRVLNECQRYSSGGEINTGILATFSDVKINDLIKHLKDKNFSEVRKWVVSNLDNDASHLLRRVYDASYDCLLPQSIPAAVLVIAKYQYQCAFVADQEINLLAALTELMVECEFK
jgi:SpoVK/Ycf46/Vps4 family AAA+-type ATPase